MKKSTQSINLVNVGRIRVKCAQIDKSFIQLTSMLKFCPNSSWAHQTNIDSENLSVKHTIWLIVSLLYQIDLELWWAEIEYFLEFRLLISCPHLRILVQFSGILSLITGPINVANIGIQSSPQAVQSTIEHFPTPNLSQNLLNFCPHFTSS